MYLKKEISKFRILLIILLLVAVAGASCKQKKSAKSEFCTEADFKTMEKVDIHCHISVERHDFMNQAVEYNFKILTINTDAFYEPEKSIAEQERTAILQCEAFPDHLAWLTTFSMKGWDDPDWQQRTISSLKESLNKGAIGVKVWKNIGMVERDKDGKFIMIDNEKFDPIFDYLEQNGIPLCGHLGEPKNCWLPLEEMTVNNDRLYFKEHPQYHMYLHPDFPSYEDQIVARDNMLRKHPELRFMGAHLGSLEWSVDELARHFDMFPNSSADLAARMCHIQKQTGIDRQKVYDFFIKYQDRILYGTDEGDYVGADPDPEKLKEKVLTVWQRDWKFLATDDMMTSWEVDGTFQGLKLPREVLEKIYYKNALKWFPGV